jgi:serine/threonine protein kinase/tetratricopeptide (TPR) repeat protein
MHPDTNKIRMIFLAAVENHPPERWETYLDETCAGDEGVRRRVEILLQAHREHDHLLDHPAPALFAVPEEPVREGAGSVIGPYTLQEQIGEGGFGIVFRAEQHEPLRRTVALKVLKPGMDSRRIIARFQAERQVLALMDHPNIARVLDAGATAGGRPFFVMELVSGVPITGYCDLHELTIRERLELFAAVCSAVQHAHQKGVIHRDLKPSNVLVTRQDSQPVVKVIDFGIAKAVGQPLTDQSRDTRSAQMIGSPLYMSPEQAAGGQDIDTRSDVYSLGVLLYELLTGTTPFDKERLRQADYDELRRIIRNEDPPRPSARVATPGRDSSAISAQRGSDPRRLSRLLRGDLDVVVMKALEKDRERRYETAGALGADVLRHLNDEPVQACPPSGWYRLRKWALRHRPLVGATAAVLLMGVTAWAVSTVLILRQRDEARTQRALAQEQREVARRAVDKMYTEVAEQWLADQPHLQEVQRRFLLEALSFYETFAREPSTDPALRLEAGMAYQRVGEIQYHLGKMPEAEAAYVRAVALYEELAAAFPDRAGYRRELGRSSNNRGIVLLELGRHREAEQACSRALSLRERLVADLPTEPDYIWQVAESQVTLGVLLEKTGRHRQAEQAYRQGIALLEPVTAASPAPAAYRGLLARGHNNLAVLLVLHSRRSEAENAYRRALALQERLVAESPARPGYRNALACTCTNLARLLADCGQQKEAEQLYRQGLDMLDRLAVDFPDVPAYRLSLAMGNGNLGVLLKANGRYPEAEQVYLRAVGLYERLVADSADMTTNRVSQAMTWNNLGNVWARVCRHREAEQAYRRAVDLFERLTTQHPDIPRCAEGLAMSQSNLADLLWDAGRRPEASEAYGQARATWEKLVADNPEVSPYARGLAFLLARSPDPAVRDPKRAAGLARQAVERGPRDTGSWLALGIAHYRAGEWPAALRALSRSRELGADHPVLWLHLAMTQEQLGEKERARRCYDRGRARLEKVLPVPPRFLVLRDEAAALLSLPPGDPPEVLPRPTGPVPDPVGAGSGSG